MITREWVHEDESGVYTYITQAAWPNATLVCKAREGTTFFSLPKVREPATVPVEIWLRMTELWDDRDERDRLLSPYVGTL